MESLYDEYRSYAQDIKKFKNAWMSAEANRQKLVIRFAIQVTILLCGVIIGKLYYRHHTDISSVDLVAACALIAFICSLTFLACLVTLCYLYEQAHEPSSSAFFDEIDCIMEKADAFADILWKQEHPFATACTKNVVFKFQREDRTDMDIHDNIALISLLPVDKKDDVPILQSVYGMQYNKNRTFVVRLTEQNRARLDKIQKIIQKRCTDLELFSYYDKSLPYMHYYVVQCTSEEDADALGNVFHALCMQIAVKISEQKMREFLSHWSGIAASLPMPNKILSKIPYDDPRYSKFEKLENILCPVKTDDILKYFTGNERENDAFSDLLLQAEQSINNAENGKDNVFLNIISTAYTS